MKLWKRSSWSILEYHKETALENRNLEDCTSILNALRQELSKIHLRGFVIENWEGVLELNNDEWKIAPKLKRPQTNFVKLEKFHIRFEDYKNAHKQEYFLAPEQMVGHHDFRTDFFCFGLLSALLLADKVFDKDENLYLWQEGHLAEDVVFFSEQYAKAVKSCLALKPEMRSITAFNELLSKALMQDRVHQKIAAFKERLVHFSANNSMLNHQESSVHFKVLDDSHLIKIISEKDAEYDTLNKLRLKSRANFRQNGINTLYLCKGLLEWKLDALQDKSWRSPILKRSVSLERLKGIESEIRVNQESGEWQVNEHLRIVFKHFLGETLPETVYDDGAQVDAFFKKLEEKYAEHGWRICENEMFIKNLQPGKYAIYRDYEKMAQLPPTSQINEILNAKEIENLANDGVSERIAFDEDFSVLPADESQQKVLAELGNEQNLVVEGPPGTGKSQLIVNAMAHYVAQGKKVLFVSDKKSALDVVYHRIEKSGLVDIACRIHDSIADKKSFVKKIEQSLRRFQKPLERDARLKRKLALWKLEEKTDELKKYKYDLTSDHGGYSMLDVFKREARAKPDIQNYTIQETLPTYGRYREDSSVLKSLERELSSLGVKKWKDLPFAFIDANQWTRESQAEAKAVNFSRSVYQQLQELEKLLNELSLSIEQLGDFYQLCGFLKSQKWLLDRGSISIVLHKTQRENFERLRDKYQHQKLLVLKYRSKSKLHAKPAEHEISSALKLLQKQESTPELEAFLKEYFGNDFFQNDLEPMLQQAKYEWQAEEKLFLTEAKIKVEYKVHDADDFINQTNLLIELADRTRIQIPELLEWLKNKKHLGKTIADIFSYLEREGEFQEGLGFLHQNWRTKNIAELKEYLHKLNAKEHWLYSARLINLFSELHPANQYFLQTSEISLHNLQTEIIAQETGDFFKVKPQYQQHTSQQLQSAFVEIDTAYEEFLSSNSAFIVDEQSRKVQGAELLIQTLAANLSAKQKVERKVLKKGRRIIEHEISKTKQYKTPRQLWCGDSSAWLKHIFPICMMSPEVVSEVFPLESGLFDVVIFDEASQVKVEEALPVLYRAEHSLVIGDSQQLQPTRFFQSKNIFEESDDEKSLDSLLQLMKMSSKKYLLNKHYRAKDTDLIAFSNAAFYRNELEMYPFAQQKAVSPIQWTLIKNGNFKEGKNGQEAEALVSRFVRLLKASPEKSFAIVAMSENQKSCIEEIIEDRAKSDLEFAEYLKNDEAKVDDGQFAGLVVRSLEQIQGDERDIVLISVAYSFQVKDKLPNFGPLAHAQGRYRLNVLFTRAKEQVQIFTSFAPDSLERTDNSSLQILRLYLLYAEARTEMNIEAKSRIIRLLSGKNANISSEKTSNLPEALTQFSKQNEVSFSRVSQSFYAVEKQGIQTDKMLYFISEESSMILDYYLAKQVFEKRGFSIFYVDVIELHRHKQKVFHQLKKWLG